MASISGIPKVKVLCVFIGFGFCQTMLYGLNITEDDDFCNHFWIFSFFDYNTLRFLTLTPMKK